MPKPQSPQVKPLARYALTRRSGNTLYISGLTARSTNGCVGVTVNADGSKSIDVDAQTMYIFKKLKQILMTEGMTFDDLVSLTCYLVNMDDFEKFNRAYERFFIATLPTRTCIAVSALPPKDAVVEITAIASRELF